MGVSVVTPACCLLFMQSCIEPEGKFLVLSSAAVQQCWALAGLCQRTTLHGCECGDTSLLSSVVARLL